MHSIFGMVRGDAVRTLEVLRFLDVRVTAADIEWLVTANPGLTDVEVRFNNRTLLRVPRLVLDVFDSVADDKREDRRGRKSPALAAAAEEVAVKFVDMFCRCKALKEMVISNKTLNDSPKSKRISESCCVFRGKDVGIFVRGVQYIP